MNFNGEAIEDVTLIETIEPIKQVKDIGFYSSNKFYKHDRDKPQTKFECLSLVMELEPLVDFIGQEKVRTKFYQQLDALYTYTSNSYFSLEDFPSVLSSIKMSILEAINRRSV